MFVEYLNHPEEPLIVLNVHASYSPRRNIEHLINMILLRKGHV